MNKNFSNFIIFLALIILGALLVNGLYFNENNQSGLSENNYPNEGLVKTSITYQASQDFSPEIATVIIGVSSRGSVLDKLITENNQKMQNLNEIINNFEPLKIETKEFSVTPINYREEGEDLLRYQVNNHVEFSTDKLDELSLILQELLQVGANRVVNIDYQLKDDKQAREAVTKLAIEGIKEKAEFVLEQFNKDDYKFVNLTINDHSSSNFMRYSVSDSLQGEAAAPPINPSDIKITVSINSEIALY